MGLNYTKFSKQYGNVTFAYPQHLLFSKATWHTVVLKHYGIVINDHYSFMDQGSKQAEVWVGHW